MNWIEGVGAAIDYIEDNLDLELEIESIAAKAYVSAFYFQKAFSLLCGFTVGEYIRQRRLALAGIALVSTDEKVIDIALRYGYDSPDSFTKAFTRFHGSTPTAVRRGGATIRSFAPLKIKFILEGGFIMDYKIVEKSEFTIIGASRMFDMETATQKIPIFWAEHYKNGGGAVVCGMYGICVDSNDKTFEYLIADDCKEGSAIPEGYKTMKIPAHTWAVFPSRGAMPEALQKVTQKIFSEWLPNCREYELSGECTIELYTDVAKYEKGNQDENYYSEVWIPVKKK